jgi:ABC-type phosphate/phosphonate transport system substrate-binding protein
MHTHTLTEWAAFLSLGVSGYAAFSAPYFLLVDAELRDFDPRPAVRRAIESGRYDALLIAVANAKHDARATAERVRRAPLHAAITAAALLALLIPASPEATR